MWPTMPGIRGGKPPALRHIAVKNLETGPFCCADLSLNSAAGIVIEHSPSDESSRGSNHRLSVGRQLNLLGLGKMLKFSNRPLSAHQPVIADIFAQVFAITCSV